MASVLALVLLSWNVSAVPVAMLETRGVSDIFDGAVFSGPSSIDFADGDRTVTVGDIASIGNNSHQIVRLPTLQEQMGVDVANALIAQVQQADSAEIEITGSSRVNGASATWIVGLAAFNDPETGQAVTVGFWLSRFSQAEIAQLFGNTASRLGGTTVNAISYNLEDDAIHNILGVFMQASWFGDL